MVVVDEQTLLYSRLVLADGQVVEFRPIGPDDVMLERDFIHHLSNQSKHFRFMGNIKECSSSMLYQFTHPDPEQEVAIIGLVKQEHEQEIAVARFAVLPDQKSCEFAIAIADAWQRKGIGRYLLRQLMAIAANRGLTQMRGLVLADNTGMLTLCKTLGFRIFAEPTDHQTMVVIKSLDKALP
ncbi:GNAT family N-acetyltransferase [Bowmanella sp. Y26]|uniref:GNAT family N-acetyltransferase n=1 Tax=Bowmanella yangjiangensis TaxID=2811230 RepID=UPI001BDCC223|nr:GNAT family N-acetyltransferase [Bowmanella yangjiangensis]MBT1063667.1 GNAT family N-acetyltransferase [Bowmanella yangjiangensis]